MATHASKAIVKEIRSAFKAAGLTDRELLARFTDGDEGAFAALVDRHGGMVFGVCRRTLPTVQDAEDACQATFLVLARKAKAGRWQTSVANWLYTTARHIAARARLSAQRREKRESSATGSEQSSVLDQMTSREAFAILDEELEKLPPRYREPLVLCYLEGLARDEAAARLGVPPATLKSQLDRGRKKLGDALTRRGVGLGAGLLAVAGTSSAGASAAGLHNTILAAARGNVSPAVAALTQGAAMSGVLRKLALAMLLLAGTAVFRLGLSPGEPPTEPNPGRSADQPERPKAVLDRHGDALPPGAIARMGTVRWRHHEEYGNQLHVVPSPTGKHVATAAIGVGVIRVFALSDGRQMCEFPWENEAGYEVRFTQDGSRVYYLAEQGVVRYFDPSTGKLTSETKPVVEQDVPRRVRGNPDVWNEEWTTHQFTRDGRWIVTAHPVERRFTLMLTEVADGRAKRRQVRFDVPEKFGKGIDIYKYTCVGNRLIAVARDRTRKPWTLGMFRWDLSTGKLTTMVLPAMQESGFDLTPDGKRLVTWRGGVKVWDTETGAEAVKLEEPVLAGYGTRFSPDGKRVVGVHTPENGEEATVTVWELDRGKVVARVRMPARFDNPHLLPDGRTLLAASHMLMLSTWDLSTGRPLSRTAGHESQVYSLAFSPDGSTLFTASADRHERIAAWDAATGRHLRDLDTPKGCSQFVVTGSDQLIASGWKRPLVWADTRTGRELRRAELEPLVAELGGTIAGFDLSACPDPRTGKPAALGLVGVSNRRRLLVLWDAESGELLHRRAFSSELNDLLQSASPDGRLVARSTSDLPPDNFRGRDAADELGHHAVVLEDTLTGSTLLRLQQPDFFISGSAVFIPNGQSVVTWTSTYPSSRDVPGVETVRLWEVRTGKQRLAFPLPVIGKWWDPGVQALAVSPDGRLLAAARNNKTISLWNLLTGEEAVKWSGYGAVVTRLAFRPDGKALASGHGDGTALIWDLSGLPPSRPAVIDRDTAWRDLASDSEKAYRAILSLSADPEGVKFLRDRVKPVAPVPADQVRKRIAELDSTDFATRERATADLAKFWDAVDTHLHAALKEKLSAEQRQRVKELLDQRGLVESDPDRLRALRCVEVLERAGTAEAVAILRTLAKGAPGTRLTGEAGNALKRLAP